MVAQSTGTDWLTVIITVADRMWRGFFINWLAASPLLVNLVRGINDAPLWDTDKHARDSARMLLCRPRHRYRSRHVRQLPVLLRRFSAHSYREELRDSHGSAVLHVDSYHGAGDQEGGTRQSSTRHGWGRLLDRGTSVILPGVTIGDGCVIAAGAVVNKHCAPNGMYAGVPTRRISELLAKD